MDYNDLLQIFLRTLLGYAILTASMRIMGKREIGQLSTFDFLIVLSVADIMIIGIENFEESVWNFIVPLVTIVVLQKIVAFIDLKIPFIRDILEGSEKMIIKNGKIIVKNMKIEKYNMNDLYTQLRAKEVMSVDEVEYAILESNGSLSVFKKSETNKGDFPLPVIISGKVCKDNLKLCGLDENWVNEELVRLNLKKEEVFGASINNGKLVVVKYNSK